MKIKRKETCFDGLMLVAAVAWALCAPAAMGQSFLVKDGQALADIVIADKPARTVKLAAAELQEHIEKISGARLAITNAPGKDVPAHVYVGRSVETDKLKIMDEGLKYGAFRMVAGDNYLALLGDDTDFVPKEPWGHNREDQARVLKAWDTVTGETFSNPYLGLYKEYSPTMGLWEADGRGSLNAVYEFLRGLGCRWYYPGKIGEILPKMKTIAVPKVDKVVCPDFDLRSMYFYGNKFFMAAEDEIKWQLRLGLNSPRDVLGSTLGHGILYVHDREEVKKAHPEYYALWGGNRAIEHKGGCGAPCLSSEGLFRQNVKFARAMFDHYGEPMLSVMPADGYSNLCQCELCIGKGAAQRGWEGQLSDYVWDYVNRVAGELNKTHPDRKVQCCSYGSYQLPPEKIDKFSPNVVVMIARSRSSFHNPQTRERYLKLEQAWLDKLPSKTLLVWDYYLHGMPKSALAGVPVYFPRLIAEDLRFLKGKSRGDFIEVYRNINSDGFKWDVLAANHLNIYVTARLYWDAGQDLDALLEEYYGKFYGPASGEMKTFIGFAETNWMKANKDVVVIDRLFDLLDKARRAAGDSVYGQRVGLLVDFVQQLKAVREELAQGRKDVPSAVAVERPGEIRLDGKLDKPFWKDVPAYELKELVSGGIPANKTTFQVAWNGKALVFGIRCEDADMKNLNIATRDKEDSNIWGGDTIDLLIETPVHSYYQIACNPAGAFMDLDRKEGLGSRWSSGVQAATHAGENYWSLELLVPAAGENAEAADPLGGVAGNKPAGDAPWFINVCRQRIRGKDTEYSAFSPTGKKLFAVPLKFGELVVK